MNLCYARLSQNEKRQHTPVANLPEWLALDNSGEIAPARHHKVPLVDFRSRLSCKEVLDRYQGGDDNVKWL
jgi:hypothetical protein